MLLNVCNEHGWTLSWRFNQRLMRPLRRLLLAHTKEPPSCFHSPSILGYCLHHPHMLRWASFTDGTMQASGLDSNGFPNTPVHDVVCAPHLIPWGCRPFEFIHTNRFAIRYFNLPKGPLRGGFGCYWVNIRYCLSPKQSPSTLPSTLKAFFMASVTDMFVIGTCVCVTQRLCVLLVYLKLFKEGTSLLN